MEPADPDAEPPLEAPDVDPLELEDEFDDVPPLELDVELELALEAALEAPAEVEVEVPEIVDPGWPQAEEPRAARTKQKETEQWREVMCL